MKTDVNCKNLLHSPTPNQCMEHYGCIYENNHLVTLLVNPADGSIADANRAACSFYGYTPKQFRGLLIADLNMENTAQLDGFVNKALPDGKYQGNKIIFEKHRLANGGIIDVEIHTGLITMLGKKCIYSVIHDITERVRSEQRLRESEERYRDLVELCPEAILVYSSGTILFANKQAEKLFGMAKEKLTGRSIDAFFHEEYISSTEYIKFKTTESAKEGFRIEQRYIRYDDRIFDLEISGVPIVYQEVKAIQLVLRDITESKKEIARAVRFQEHRHAVMFPLETRADLQKLYVPASTLSGDFFIFHKINEEQVIGIIGDVTGKGITAALNITAVRVLFSESLLVTHEPVEVLHDLNDKVLQHLVEDYISVCCFHLDFRAGRLKAAGAGINEFMFMPKDNPCEKMTVRGAPIGMFSNSEFDQVDISFQSGDRFCFYSDGVDLLVEDGEPELYCDYEYLQQRITSTSLQDDCTWLSLYIR
ncbi:PAS domain S-box protein [Paenibacillus sp. BR2-3]|uniref:SpoIIE family protein phosphatase n=1 Tax=Paenibacillus sp. BR2-3 TaxID=3048494 RepID=UPI0039776B3D